MIYYTDYDGSYFGLSGGLVWIVLTVVLAVVLAFYLLRSFGIYALTKRAGIKNAWLSFVPCGWTWVAGQLVKEPKIFGVKVKKFHVWLFAIVTACQVFTFVNEFLSLFPLVGYFLQGGEIYISEINLTGYNYVYYPLVGELNIFTPNKILVNYVYNESFINVLNVFIIIFNVADLAEIFFVAVFYAGLFSTYFPKRYLLATILSLFGLFAPFVFAIRNNKAVDYGEYVRSRYRAMNGGNPYNPYGNPYQNPYSDPFGNGNANVNKKDEPFEEFEEKKKGPFEEFEEKNDKDE